MSRKKSTLGFVIPRPRPMVSISRKTGLLTISTPYLRRHDRSYEVQLLEINAPYRLLRFLYHLSSRNWVDRTLIHAIIKRVRRHFGWWVN